MIAAWLVPLFLFVGITAASDPSHSYDPDICGGELNARNATILKPGQPSGHTKSEHCEWLLRGEPGKRTMLRFVMLALASNAQCAKDYVEIRETKNDRDRGLLGRYCGANIPPLMVSSPGADTKLIYHTGASTSNVSGFHVFSHTLEDVCGYFTADHGTLSWPNATGSHRDECQWFVNSQPGKSTRFEVEILSTNKNPDCQRDYYELSMHVLNKFPVRIRPCDRKTSWTLTSAGPTTIIKFRPRGTRTFANVRVSYSTVENAPHRGPLIRDDGAKRLVVDYGPGDYTL